MFHHGRTRERITAKESVVVRSSVRISGLEVGHQDVDRCLPFACGDVPRPGDPIPAEHGRRLGVVHGSGVHDQIADPAHAQSRPRGQDPDAAAAKLEIDLTGDPRLNPGGKNVIEVRAFNGAGYLRSRGVVREFDADGPRPAERPQVWAVIAGTSKYRGEALELRYAAKDAEDFATALSLAGERLFGKGKVHLTLLSTGRTKAEEQPTRDNLLKALDRSPRTRHCT